MGDRRYIKTTICDKWHDSQHLIFVLKCVWRYNLMKLQFHLLVIGVHCLFQFGHIYDSRWRNESRITEMCAHCEPLLPETNWFFLKKWNFELYYGPYYKKYSGTNLSSVNVNIWWQIDFHWHNAGQIKCLYPKIGLRFFLFFYFFVRIKWFYRNKRLRLSYPIWAN